MHGPLFPDLDDGIHEFVDALNGYFPAGARLGVDEQTHPMLRALGHFEWSDASGVLGAAKILKTPDEVSAIREAQRITEQAMESAREALRPGMRQTELSGIFLRRLFELGTTANAIDPIWQVMTPDQGRGPLDHPRRPGLPDFDDRSDPARGRRHLGRRRHLPPGLRLGLRPDLDHERPPGPHRAADVALRALALRRGRGP